MYTASTTQGVLPGSDLLGPDNSTSDYRIGRLSFLENIWQHPGHDNSGQPAIGRSPGSS